MKNEIISFLSQKNNYPVTPKGKVDFLIEVYKKVKSRDVDCEIKTHLINRIHKDKISRFNRGVVFKRKEFFGVKYNSFINFAPFHQERLIKLLHYIYDYSKSNNILDIEYVKFVSNEISNLEYSLSLASERENIKMQIDF